MPHTAYIYDAIRTPRGAGKQSGSLNEVKPVSLGAGLLTELQQRHNLDTSYVDDVIMGCVTPAGEQGGDVAKHIVQFANWDESIPGVQIDRFCASGLEAVNMAAQKIASGWEDLIVAGGVESMSRVPMGASGGAWLNDPEMILNDSIVPQGIGADTIATIGGWSRTVVDTYAAESQKRAAFARDNGYFDKSVVAVKDLNGLPILAKDEFIRPGTTVETLSGLKPVFAPLGAMGFDDMVLKKYPDLMAIDHVHTAGNSSGIVDGSSAVLVGSEKAGKDLGLKPRARIISAAVLATEPTIMLTGPGPAAKKALAKAGLTAKDIDLFEVNEAFASIVLRFMQDLDVSHDIVNVNGGAIAMGHPLGATGGMLVGTLLDELERRDLQRGMVALCVGGGMGIATIIERV
ncbi:acetyl-CoA C-acetyltransferase [Pseudomaricurvus sp. HS19]|uniref:acetyl-CoA C-acetyltransferase n=1 Tax=Pseudomaricurvus sp. HS19 TaxID=2692626 RepID=UPI0013698C20|nr:acetyl-CoA C-acetyltransferase [Pseudomaricurvus sp. HS19]MYM62940.1 acetyl-CoA C-acetyltransferase [Pseudomaricurvus sp. HS19]